MVSVLVFVREGRAVITLGACIHTVFSGSTSTIWRRKQKKEKLCEETPSVFTFLVTPSPFFSGGDQGLLNMYFKDWARKDITRHLSFIYNMNSNVAYTYLPAYKQFGRDVKIVHFLGAVKPWHHMFNLLTGHVQPQGDSQHMFDHLQFWWELFMTHVQPKLFPECAGLAGEMSKLTIKTAEELRQFGAGQPVVGGSEARQYAWERGQIDYLGEDAFANIQRKLDTAMTTPAEPPLSKAAPQKQSGEQPKATPEQPKSKKQAKK